MITLETERLLLRPFTSRDYEAVFSYSSVPENVKFMVWGPNDEDATRKFLAECEEKRACDPMTEYDFAIVIKAENKVIGGCGIYLSKEPNTAMLGWILHRDYWKQGYMPEAATALLKYCFEELKLHRVFATCNTENYSSYRVMEKIGMRREAHFIKNRYGRVCDSQIWYDEYHYAILDEEWEAKKEIEYYCALPCHFDGFIDIPKLSDGTIELVCTNKCESIPEKKYVPAYIFEIRKNGQRVGVLGLRIGYTEGLYYGGQIGYAVDEPHRGNGYAAAACRLVLPVAKAHGMTKLLITNDVNNFASRRVCEKLGLRFVRTALLPEWTELYCEGQRYINIFEWSDD